MLPRALRFKRPLHRCNACNPNAELNHRGQICEVLIDTGISHRGKRNPKRTESGVRPLLRPCAVSADAPDSLGKWTGIGVSRPVLRFGRPACVSQHLCPKNWNPVRESHSLTWFCRPLPGLFGQRDVFKPRGPVKDQILCRADPDSHADSSRRALNRSRNPRCDGCDRESRPHPRPCVISNWNLSVPE